MMAASAAEAASFQELGAELHRLVGPGFDAAGRRQGPVRLRASEPVNHEGPIHDLSSHPPQSPQSGSTIFSSAPSTRMSTAGLSIAPRSLDHVELAREASKAGFAAVVTKDHDYSGVMTAALIARHFPELTTKVYSGIVLNNVVGGLNPYAVEHTAAMGGKIVWMPTLAAKNHMRWEKTSGWVHPASTQKMRPASVVPVLDDDKTVRDDVK